MKKLFLLMACCFMMLSMVSFAQEDAAANDMMKAWTDYMTPGAVHEMLASCNGAWKTTATMWQAPNMEPVVGEGTTMNEMILGGRYQKSSYKGEMMGMPFEGVNTLAYDNATKEFISTWIDNMGTGMMICKGKYNEDEKMVEMNGTYVDPMSKTEKPFRETFKLVDNDHQVLEMYVNDDNGDEFMTMKIEYTRQ